jgi:hypothetical protein
MADPKPQPYELDSFPKIEQPFDTAEDAARAALQSLLIHSISTRNEYGGMICQWRGKYHVMPYVEGERNSVSVGQDAPDKGCPIEGSTPVAYYHTHPNLEGAGMKMEPDKMSPEDKGVARDANIDAYMGSLTGLFLKYDHRTRTTYSAGKRLVNSVPLPNPPKSKPLPPRKIRVAPPL